MFKVSSLLIAVFTCLGGFSQTAHDAFMSENIKQNSSGNLNYWVHGENEFKTVTDGDWNTWKYSYLGLEGEISTINNGIFINWSAANGTIAISAHNPQYTSWSISGEDNQIEMVTTNWNTWAITGNLVSGISTTVTDDFSEWELNGGDWTNLSPHMRSAVVFTAVISSAILQDLSE